MKCFKQYCESVSTTRERNDKNFDYRVRRRPHSHFGKIEFAVEPLRDKVGLSPFKNAAYYEAQARGAQKQSKKTIKEIADKIVQLLKPLFVAKVIDDSKPRWDDIYELPGYYIEIQRKAQNAFKGIHLMAGTEEFGAFPTRTKLWAKPDRVVDFIKNKMTASIGNNAKIIFDLSKESLDAIATEVKEEFIRSYQKHRMQIDKEQNISPALRNNSLHFLDKRKRRANDEGYFKKKFEMMELDADYANYDFHSEGIRVYYVGEPHKEQNEDSPGSYWTVDLELIAVFDDDGKEIIDRLDKEGMSKLYDEVESQLISSAEDREKSIRIDYQMRRFGRDD